MSHRNNVFKPSSISLMEAIVNFFHSVQINYTPSSQSFQSSWRMTLTSSYPLRMKCIPSQGRELSRISYFSRPQPLYSYITDLFNHQCTISNGISAWTMKMITVWHQLHQRGHQLDLHNTGSHYYHRGHTLRHPPRQKSTPAWSPENWFTIALYRRHLCDIHPVRVHQLDLRNVASQ